MTALMMGAAAFFLMALGDWLGGLRRARGAGVLFPVGCLMLAGATVWLVVIRRMGWRRGAAGILCLLAAAGALALLVYTVFFAVPRAAEKRPLTDWGVYALCRHPGVWWLGVFYLALWGVLGGGIPGFAFVLFTGLDILYVLWQDRHVFPKTIAGYEAYRKPAPFLIPTRSSIRRCAATWGKAGKTGLKKKKGSGL